MLPNFPSHNNDYRIQTLAQLLGRAPVGVPPPGREVPRSCSRCNSSQDQTLQDQRPNLPSENTGEQNVIDLSPRLDHKRGRQLGEAGHPLRGIHHPTPVVNGRPDEKIAALRGPTPPNPPPWGKFYGGHDMLV